MTTVHRFRGSRLKTFHTCREVNSTDINAKNAVKNDIAGVNSINVDANDAVTNDIADTKSISTNINNLVDDYAGIDFHSIHDRNKLDESFKANAQPEKYRDSYPKRERRPALKVRENQIDTDEIPTIYNLAANAS